MLSKLLSRLLLPEDSGTWVTPAGAMAMTRAIHALRPVFRGLSALETWSQRGRLRGIGIDRPVYVCGIARAGTTITLDMLHQHPDAATHRYYNMPLPYLPDWGTRLIRSMQLENRGAVERIHADRLKVTKDSPEAVEERLWISFFDGLHDEGRSNVLDARTRNPRFERFYRDHIRKLLRVQGRTRYIVKNNYDLTRIGYLLHLFGDARFLIIVRNPVSHVASFVKQHRLFKELYAAQPALQKSTEIVGHFEFGPGLRFINAGRPGETARIRALWDAGRELEAWAAYWASLYAFVADSLERDAALAARSLVVRYEDLCRDSARTIDAMLEHIGFAPEPFAEVRARYVESLTEPTYYTPDFTPEDVAAIRRITRDVASRFGYDDRS